MKSNVAPIPSGPPDLLSSVPLDILSLIPPGILSFRHSALRTFRHSVLHTSGPPVLHTLDILSSCPPDLLSFHPNSPMLFWTFPALLWKSSRTLHQSSQPPEVLQTSSDHHWTSSEMKGTYSAWFLTPLVDASTSEINSNPTQATPLVDTSTSEINSNITEVLSDNTTPPSIPSSTHAASLAVKVEFVNHTKTTIVIDAKPDTIKKRQPSTKPMRVSAKITAQNLCTLNWQSDGHQKEPASVFASYWNGLSKADKEVYKCKADAQLKSAGVSTTSNDVE
ncbi:uncharacterized protein BJ212DRAFT_1482077 [Suillus subaureus]|uniref:Uncharacterized protein n=1 Tax=Suillus subaureus TaxID=48587 RepID=A0A9P7E8D6_9AGAM|nr:uncharacterized protein BJ212DRAFT_1482077 [Suillus subaureus]KAG1814333.1 hypothetical protein BJ212DRAFT_1482077 [Suillus subaureus]